MYDNPSIPDTLLISLIGFVTVFAVLVVLMVIIKLISAASAEKKAEAKTEAAPAPAPAPAAAPAVTSEADSADNIDDKTIALLMAIVANEIGEPLEKLNFISIKEVK